MTASAKKYTTLIAIAIAVIGMATYGIAAYTSIGRPHRSTTKPMSYWIEGGDGRLTSTIKQSLKQAGYAAAAGSEATANIIVSQSSRPGAVPIQLSSTGHPAKLGSGAIVTPVITPSYYLSTHAGTKLAASTLSSLAKQLAAGLQTQPPNQWTLAAVGDIIIGRTVYQQMQRYNDPLRPFASFADTLKTADLTLADLECSLSDSHAVITDSGMTFVSPFASAAGLKTSGFDAVNLANNHSYNGGADGFTDTLDEMERLGIRTFGGGRNETEAHQPLILTTHGVKVALLGYSSIVGSQPAGTTTPGMAYISMAPWGPFSEPDVTRMGADIRSAKAKADIVMVYYHWGTEYTHDANADQRTVAHRAIDAGADLILGTHPHWVQGVEWYKDRLISYSLGNFVFDQEWSTKTKQGTLLKATFNGSKLTSAELVPYQIEDYLQPRPVDAATSQQILSNVFTHSWWP